MNKIISKKYLVMRMRENLFLSGKLEKVNHTKCLIEDISRSGYSWKEIEKIAKK